VGRWMSGRTSSRFGVMLVETLIGTRPFGGETTHEVITSVLGARGQPQPG
jgi:hypothetical protein